MARYNAARYLSIPVFTARCQAGPKTSRRGGRARGLGPGFDALRGCPVQSGSLAPSRRGLPRARRTARRRFDPENPAPMRPTYQVTELLGDGIGPELSRAIHTLAEALPI